MTRKIDTRYPIELTLLPETTEAEILQNIYCILTTVKGSVPHLRDYGIDSDFMHQPVPAAKAAYAAAVSDAISLFTLSVCSDARLCDSTTWMVSAGWVLMGMAEFSIWIQIPWGAYCPARR